MNLKGMIYFFSKAAFRMVEPTRFFTIPNIIIRIGIQTVKLRLGLSGGFHLRIRLETLFFTMNGQKVAIENAVSYMKLEFEPFES